MSARIHCKGRSAFHQPMPPHRRQHIHGRIQPMAGPKRPASLTGLLGVAVALFCLLYFAAQLARPFL